MQQHLQYYNGTKVQSQQKYTTIGALGQVMRITVHQAKQPTFQAD